MSIEHDAVIALTDIRQHCEEHKGGICFGLRTHESMRRYPTEDIKFLQRQLFECWPEYSGDPIYPVPSTQYADPQDAYWALNHSRWQGEYGDTRKRLLDFMIDELKKNSFEVGV